MYSRLASNLCLLQPPRCRDCICHHPRLDTSLPCGKWHSQCIMNKHSKSSPQLLSFLPKEYRQIFYMGKPTLTLQKKIPTPQIISLQSKCFSWWSLGSTVKVFYIPSDMRSLLRVHFLSKEAQGVFSLGLIRDPTFFENITLGCRKRTELNHNLGISVLDSVIRVFKVSKVEKSNQELWINIWTEFTKEFRTFSIRFLKPRNKKERRGNSMHFTQDSMNSLFWDRDLLRVSQTSHQLVPSHLGLQRAKIKGGPHQSASPLQCLHS